MSVTVSFRVPEKLKRKMDSLRKYINWSEELRKFVESRIKEYEQQKAVKELEEIIKEITPSPRGTAAKYVREDRDSH